MKVTLENLKAKNACADGYKFGEECLAAGLDPVQECANRYIDWFVWLVENGFDCESARRDGFTWDESGRVTASAGHEGTASAGDKGTASAGDRGVVSILHWDGTKYRRRCAEVGEGGLKPNTPYKLNEAGEFVEVEVPA
jgi:hypothetical protein